MKKHVSVSIAYLKRLIQGVSPEALLQGVEGQSAQLGCNEVGPVLHDLLEPDVLLRALPRRHQVQHVLAVRGLPSLLACRAGQLHAERLEDGFLCLKK